MRRDAYMEGVVTGTSNVLQGGSTTNTYDVNNNLAAVTDSTKAANNRTFINDAGGRILQSTQNGNTQRQLVVNGEVLGRYGSYLNPDKPADSSGNPLFVTGSSFNFGYTKISGSYPAANPGTKVVAAGDTLASIAKSVYGDSSLWYLIADANGLGGDRDLRVGQTLTVPSRVTGARNNSNSFKPYNPGEVVGNTTPNLPSPPSGGGGGCGGLAVIIQIVVTVAVTIYTGSAVAGNLAGQLVGNVLGTQNGIDWSAVAMAAVTQEISAGIGDSGVDFTGSGDISSWGNMAARAAVSNAITQTVAVSVGIQQRFDWTGVAASAVSAGVNTAVGDTLSSSQIFSGWDPQYGKFAQNALKGFVSGMTVNAMRGGRLTELQVATDAFGNALGESWGESMKRAGTQESKLDATLQEDRQRQATQAAAYDQLLQAFGQDNSGDRYAGVQVADAGGYGGDGVVSDAGGGVAEPGLSFADDVAARKVASDPMGLKARTEESDKSTTATPVANARVRQSSDQPFFPEAADLGGDRKGYESRAADFNSKAQQMREYADKFEQAGDAKMGRQARIMADGYAAAAERDRQTAQQFTTHTTPMWERESSAVVDNQSLLSRDRLTGLPLDEQGRYTVFRRVDDKDYAPKFFSCATTDCVNSGASIDLSDPGTQAYVKASNKQVFDDINKGATVATIVNPAGAMGTIAGLVGPATSIASGYIDGKSVDAFAKEALQWGANQYLEKVYKIPSAIAERGTAIIDYFKGWENYIQTVKSEMQRKD